MKSLAYGATRSGCRRENNEDYFVIEEDMNLYVVCDGMGGHLAGEVASETASATVVHCLRSHRDLVDEFIVSEDYAGIEALVQRAVSLASRAVLHRGDRDPECYGMGTTLTMLFAAGSKAIVAHVGDSRAYQLQGDAFRQVTCDHTYANVLLQAGLMDPDEVQSSGVARFLLRTLGRKDNFEVDTVCLDIADGDRFLLCSDGLSDHFDSDREVARLMTGEDLQGMPDRLLELANKRGGHDDATAIVVEFGDLLMPVGHFMSPCLTLSASGQEN